MHLEKSDLDSTRVRAFECVRAAVARVVPKISTSELDVQTSVVEDLGLDSLRFVDLALALEEVLGISEFPLQDWYDAEAAHGGRFTVGSLVEVCAHLMRNRSSGH